MQVSVVIVSIGLTSCITRWLTLEPEHYCKTSPAGESWAPDRAYKATVLQKNCNLYESVFYSVRVDGFSTPERTAWFTTTELEVDDDHTQPPELVWGTPRQLEIAVTTTALSG